MSPFRLGANSLKKLEGVHPDLVRVVKRAIELTPVDFTITDGVRSLETQKLYLAQGRTKTLNSAHLTGDAVDVAPWVAGKIPWNNTLAFQEVAEAMFSAADELGILIQWGADWDLDGIRVDRDSDESFLDMPHFQRPKLFRQQAAREAMRRRERLREMNWTGDIL
jgi:peptidoglycan L-alanyl-D-glutamate endopeptidase CwlK